MLSSVPGRFLFGKFRSLIDRLIPCLAAFRPEVLVGLVVHALWALWERRRHAWVSAEPHAYVISAAQCAVIAMFTLRGIVEPITVATQEIGASPVELRHPATACNPIDDARADEIWPPAAKSTRRPFDWCGLFDISPFPALLPDTVQQDQATPLSSELDRCDALAVTRPFPTTSIARPQAALPVEAVDVKGAISPHGRQGDIVERSSRSSAANLPAVFAVGALAVGPLYPHRQFHRYASSQRIMNAAIVKMMPSAVRARSRRFGSRR
jgi:hypothetical protein